MRVVVVGGRAQLGAAVAAAFASGHDVTALGHDRLDIAADGAVVATMSSLRPEVIVNCAAYNDVDGAEDHPVAALDVNAFGVRALARSAAQHDAILVHYSSDFVFDGAATEPYTEEDRPRPRSVYAASKLIGEWFAADAPRHYVLRVESLFGCVKGGPAPRGTIASFVKKMKGGEVARVFRDRTVSPTYVPDAARATRALVERGGPAGLYHCVNSGNCTWLEFAEALARQLGVTPHLTPMSMADATFRAERPQFCALSNRKLLAAGIAMPTWQDALRRYALNPEP